MVLKVLLAVFAFAWSYAVNVEAQDSGDIQNFDVGPELGKDSNGDVYFLEKKGDSWQVSNAGDLRNKNVERVIVDMHSRKIYLGAMPPAHVSQLEQNRGPGNGNKWECYSGLGGSGYRDANSYSVCSSGLTKSVTSAGDALVGSLNILLGSVRGYVAVDQDKVLAAVKSSGLPDLLAKKIEDRNQEIKEAAAAQENLKQQIAEDDQKAEQGGADAKYKRGLDYLNGSGVEADQDIARSWFEKASKEGSPEASYELGNILKNEGSITEALHQWRIAANAGNTGAKQAIKEYEESQRKEKLAELEREKQQHEEQANLEKFRRELKIGTDTFCGAVIDVRGPMIQIALSNPLPGYPGDLWLKRNEVYPLAYGCNNLNGHLSPAMY